MQSFERVAESAKPISFSSIGITPLEHVRCDY